MDACDNSLRRLGTDYLDLYLLHWPRDDGAVSEETFEAFEELVGRGKIRYWGVSNFARADLDELVQRSWGSHLTTNQILYNLRRRGPESEILPWSAEHGVPIMAYSPIEGGRMLGSDALQAVARRHDATPAQVALAWLLRQSGVMAIPKAGSVAHVTENRHAASLQLTAEDLAELDVDFPAPSGPTPFEMG